MGLFGVIGAIVALIIIATSKSGNTTKRLTTNNPRIFVEAVLVAKRTNISNNTTVYYLTFQFESGDRTEFMVNGQDYGMFIEGDYGKLLFQGRKFISFERTPFLTTEEKKF